MTLFLILLCSLLPTAPVLGPLQPPKSEVGVDNEGFTVADPGEGLGWQHDLYLIFGINNTRDISKLSQISLA